MTSKELIESYAAGNRDFRDVNLRHADLRGANLRGANLCDANLCGANLCDVKDLSEREIAKRLIVPAAGDLHVWKKLVGGTICQLIIPDGTPRIGGLIGRKCRAQSALVINGEGVSSHDGATKYRVGDLVIAKNWDPSPLVECSGGIHFFLTREEAEDY